MVDKIGTHTPPVRAKDAPKQIITKYGAVYDNGSLEHLDQQEFLAWVKGERVANPSGSFPDTTEGWVVLWKHFLRDSYIKKWFELADKLP